MTRTYLFKIGYDVIDHVADGVQIRGQSQHTVNISKSSSGSRGSRRRLGSEREREK